MNKHYTKFHNNFNKLKIVNLFIIFLINISKFYFIFYIRKLLFLFNFLKLTEKKYKE